MNPTQARAYHALNAHTQIGVPFASADVARIMQREICITLSKYDVQEAARYARSMGHMTSYETPRGSESTTLWTRHVDLPPLPAPFAKTRVVEKMAADVTGGGVSNRTNRVRMSIPPWELSA